MKNLKIRLVLSILSLILLFSTSGFTQGVGIGIDMSDVDNSAILELQDTTKGFLMTRLTTAQRDAIVDPAEGLIIFNQTTKCFEAWVDDLWQKVWCSAVTQGADSITSAPPPLICSETPLQLSVFGNLPSGAEWVWYADGCGTENSGIAVGTGQTITVDPGPASSTTYYVRSEGTTNTDCVSIFIEVEDQPVAQTITKNPDQAAVGESDSVSATFSVGFGGVNCADVHEYRIKPTGGSWGSWLAYIEGTNISTVDVEEIEIRTCKTNCDAAAGCIENCSPVANWIVTEQICCTFTDGTTRCVGDNYQGGRIAYFYEDGDNGYEAGKCHGIVATNNDQTTTSTKLQWGCAGKAVGAAAQNQQIGDGLANTNAIVAFHDDGSNFDCTDYYTDEVVGSSPCGCWNDNDGTVAAKICADLVENGYSDWFLPSRNEWTALIGFYESGNSNLISSQTYWTSSETSNQSFSNSDAFIGSPGWPPPGSFIKDQNYMVRCIRYFEDN